MNRLSGTGRLIRLILRRDRALLPIWVAWLGIIAPIAAAAFQGLYPDEAALAVAAKGFANNPAFRAMFGPVFATNVGGLTAWRVTIVMVVAAVISLLTVIRHTRVEEETGRRELIGSTVVGRQAPLAAALAVVAGANLVIAAISAVGLVGLGLAWSGAVALGLEIAAAGLLFAAVGAVAAQLTESAGGARAIALGTLALFYVVRAAGDAADAVSWLAWFSPLGWIQRVAAFGGERWWLLGVASLLAVGVAAVAVAVAARRDVGGGVMRPRPGPATAARSLRTPLALAWRLHRGMLAGWTAAFVVLGALYGSVAEAVGDMLRDNPDMQEIFARLAGGADTIIDLYLAGVAGVLGLIASGYAIQAALRMRVEEEGQRLEPLLATAVARSRWLRVQILFALGGPVVALVVGGFALGLAYGAVSGEIATQVPRLVASTLVMLGAVWLLAGIAVALFGLRPALAPAVWGVFGAVVFISFFGAILDLGQWFLDLSPFTHIPALPGADFEVLPLAALGLLTGALLLMGLRGFARRDVG